jgi:uncharacterized membrane protein
MVCHHVDIMLAITEPSRSRTMPEHAPSKRHAFFQLISTWLHGVERLSVCPRWNRDFRFG